MENDYGRIDVLLQKYGNPFEVCSKEHFEEKKSTNNIKILKLTIMSGKSTGVNKAVKFPESTLVKDLKVYIGKYFKLDKEKLLLKYKHSSNTQYVMEPLDNDDASLVECFAEGFGNIIVEEV